MTYYSPAEAPVIGGGGTVRTEYEVVFMWSFYGETKQKSWTFQAERPAREKVRELLGQGIRPEYVWLKRHVETSLPLVEQAEEAAS
jgi:hypothetical protein